MTKDMIKELEKLQLLKGGLVVSVQAAEGEPLCHPDHILALALSALNGGAAGLRLEGASNIAHVRKSTIVPIVGLTKSKLVPEKDWTKHVYITPTFEDAEEIAEAGADIIAIDATDRQRPGGVTVAKLIERIQKELNKPVWADCSTLADGLTAAKAGADVISTTLSGYTQETKVPPETTGPDLKLLEAFIRLTDKPVVLEGRVWHPAEVAEAFTLGAFSCVVGSAITRPQLITQRFVNEIRATVNA